MSEARLVLRSLDRLGEGPCWAADEGRIYWLDIHGRRLRWLVHATGVDGAFELPVRASVVAPRATGGLILVTEAGLAVIDPATGAFELVQPIRLPDGYRTNDGKVDPQGDLWWSSMDDDGGAQPGQLFRTGADLVTRPVLDGVHIANTVSFSADGATLFLADSRRQTIFLHPVAEPAHRRVFATTSGDATPDGGAMDADGFLWSAQWGGGRLVRYDPQGEIERAVAVPVSQPTSCAFGGPGLTTLYVTSAWDGLSPAERASQPLAGSLFAIETETPGLPIPAFRG